MKNMPNIVKTDVNIYFILFTSYVKKGKYLKEVIHIYNLLLPVNTAPISNIKPNPISINDTLLFNVGA